jgi:uncharacterized protein (DUF58 family)
MVKRWLQYLAALACCLVFYFSYREWFSYILLLAVLALPWLSLLLSLPAIFTIRVRLHLPDSLPVGFHSPVRIGAVSPFPLPQWRARILVKNLMWGKEWVISHGSDFPTEFCGNHVCKATGLRVYDYLGLFRLRVRTSATCTVSVRPKPQKPDPAPDVEQFLSQSWRPKSGGGFAENHELRLYRPGDHLKQIHWKLSAKTGKLIYREPMIPEVGRLLVWFYHSGDPALVGRKLGQMIWVSGYLLRLGLQHDILAYTAGGQLLWHIGREHSPKDALDQLLSIPPMSRDPEILQPETADWQFYIGGDDYEKV